MLRPAQGVLAALLALIALPAGALGATRKPPAPKPLPAPKPPLTYLLTPTDQLGFPGQKPGTLVTPEGGLYTGWTELAFNVGGTESFDPRSHSLAEGRYPVVHLFRAVRGVLYELDTFQGAVGDRPVVFARVSMKNLLPRVNRARVGAGVRYDGGEFGPRGVGRCCIRIYRFPRPRVPDREGLYGQPGVGFNAAWAYSISGAPETGTTLLRDNLALLLYPGGGDRITVSQALQPEPPPVNTRTQFGRTIYDVGLRARERRELVFRMPVEPVAPTDPAFNAIAAARFGQYRGIVVGMWKSLLRQAMRVELPERKVVDTFYASIVNDALSRYRTPDGYWVQAVNKLRYHAFWLRDAAIISDMYDLVGLHDLARENLEWFPSWQREDGLFISRPEEFDGFGQALWGMGEHVRRTGDADFARRMLPAVSRAMDWFERQRASEPTGLMPPNVNLQDNELVRGHLAGDNFWAAAGVSGAVDLARAAGDAGAAGRWQAVYDAFTTRLKGHIYNAQKGNGGAIPPSLDFKGGQDWGNLWASYPHRVLDPNSAVVTRTLQRARRRFREGIATYADTRLLHHYLGFRVFETELMRGEQRNVVEGLYAELAHTTGTGAGFEAGTAPFGDRVVDDVTVPHGWFAAEYATLLRNMLVREEGNDVWLMSAVSPAWLRPGKRISVAGAPTRQGPVAYTLAATPTGATLTWRADVKAGTRLRWPVPYMAREVSAPGLSRRTGLITLPGRSGRLSVRWKLAGDDPTFEKTFLTLMRQYFESPSGAVEAAAARRRGALPVTPSK
ncbi:MAG: hypothetical protein QOE65_828 [Solirubrobacteraceae bacterium]|nr:hypothetical protein [Solirubrobacteraceae bacterium]